MTTHWIAHSASFETSDGLFHILDPSSAFITRLDNQTLNSLQHHANFRLAGLLGWLAPIVITAKILLQDLWAVLNWDEDLAEHLKT